MKREDYYFEIHIDAPLNTALSGTTENCPSISNLISNICTCAKGFRPTNDLKECGKKF
jgi:hypothetical protein